MTYIETLVQTKGEKTHQAILGVALTLAEKYGLEGLTIGLVAEKMQMSKSGVFAHFGSREDLQVSVVKEYFRVFNEMIFKPALKEKRGLPRLEKLIDLWIQLRTQEISTGCIFVSGAIDFDDRPGAVRDELVSSVTLWRKALSKAIKLAVDEGHLRPDRNQKVLLFSIYSILLGLHHDARFLQIEESVELAREVLSRLIEDHKNYH